MPRGPTATTLAATQKLLGTVLERAAPEPGTAVEQLALLTHRVKQLSAPAVNPYQTSFFAFLSECVWTADEARGGRVAQAPDWPFLLQLSDLLITKEKLFLEKSRRVFASWTVCAFDVWVAAGGQDPRWKNRMGESVLMHSTGYRQVWLASRKYESSIFFLERRVRFIVEQFLRRGGKEKWPEFPDFTWREQDARCSNGSVITAVAQGSDQLRGPAATLVHLEELSFWEEAKQTVEGLIPTTQGGGHVVAVTTPRAGSYAQMIRDGSLSRRGIYR